MQVKDTIVLIEMSIDEGTEWMSKSKCVSYCED